MFATRMLLAATLTVCACKKPGPPPPASTPLAEVELTIDVRSQVKGKQYVFVTPEPCDSPLAGKAKFGLAPVRAGVATFIEVFVPQGTSNYVCAAALDEAGQLVGLGGAEGNPLPMSGKGEVLLKPVVLISALPAARAPPTGLMPY